MVDYESYFQYGGTDGRNGSLKPSATDSGCGSCSDCQVNTGLTERYRTRFDTPECAGAKEWHPEQYLLCPPRVLGYILQEKQWAQLQVSLLSELPSEDSEEGAWNSRLRLADDIDQTKTRRKKGEGSP